MAKDMDDYEFWLPSEILTDDDILMDYKHKSLKGSIGSTEVTGVYSPAVAPSGPGSYTPFSGFTSPDESLRSSTTETESDEEEDYLAGVTQKMVHSSLQESSIWKTHKPQVTSGSPQSTLCGFTGCGSPNCRSPPAYNRCGDASWDLLCAAAGEVERMRMTEEAAAAAYSRNRGWRVKVPPRQRPAYAGPNMGLHCDKSLSYHQLQAEQFRQLQKQQLMKQQESVVQGRGQNMGRPLGLAPSAWPTLNQSQLQLRKQQQGSGMRTVFLGDTPVKKHCAGTGVFLPRPIAETNRRPAASRSTVLLPERLIRTLNMSTMEAPTLARPHINSPFIPNNAAVASRCKVLQVQDMQQNGSSNAGMMNQEFRLPSDWTY